MTHFKRSVPFFRKDPETSVAYYRKNKKRALFKQAMIGFWICVLVGSLERLFPEQYLGMGNKLLAFLIAFAIMATLNMVVRSDGEREEGRLHE
jgi:hypothetical protein